MTSPDPGTFNRAELLERMMDDEELLQEVVDTFLADVPHQLETIRNAREQRDADTLAGQAHTLKGAAANMAAEPMRAAAERLERAGKSGDWAQAAQLLEELEERFAELKGVLEGNQGR